MEAGLTLYRLATALAAPLAPLLLARRAARGKEERPRTGERLGRASLPRPPGPLVWLHAASVGETLSVAPLIERLGETRPDLSLLLTTGTATSAELAAKRLGDRAMHQFVPLDTPRAVAGFLGHWRPDAGILVESELWPRLLIEARDAGVRLALVNARLSARSQRRWTYAPRSAARLLGLFDLIAAQSEGDAARIASLGGKARFLGNLKFDGPAPPADAAALEALRETLGGRPVLVAASTHEGEEAAIIAAHRALAAELDCLLTIIVPRHPERGAAVADQASAAGLRVARRTGSPLPEPATGVFVMDTLGELGLAYRIGGAAFVGGSLMPVGGHNPIEAAKLDCPILHGPHVDNFRDVYAALDQDGGATLVTDAGSLAREAGRMLRDPDAARAQAQAAREIVEASSGALERVLAALLPLLPERT